MSYEKELFDEVIYVAAEKLSPNDAADLREWVESLEFAKRKADEYEEKAKAWDRMQALLEKCTHQTPGDDYEVDWYEFEIKIDEVISDYESAFHLPLEETYMKLFNSKQFVVKVARQLERLYPEYDVTLAEAERYYILRIK